MLYWGYVILGIDCSSHSKNAKLSLPFEILHLPKSLKKSSPNNPLTFLGALDFLDDGCDCESTRGRSGGATTVECLRLDAGDASNAAESIKEVRGRPEPS
jgi:hypothetical protein